ncbi:cdc42 gtpase-activating protein [Holotrichia oblita]|uniref:Cdc42 gtpase-activating protein n=1 Tax=Holotrichia oblita TaxID=644536 RepID=A0ACB9SHR3_HOLOL|nr:cdc42 gtpase-activating protein [Holotrichia oblita]
MFVPLQMALKLYLEKLCCIVNNSLNCGPVLNWLQMDNKGHRLLVPSEESRSINTPAVAAAYSIRRYVSQVVGVEPDQTGVEEARQADRLLPELHPEQAVAPPPEAIGHIEGEGVRLRPRRTPIELRSRYTDGAQGTTESVVHVPTVPEFRERRPGVQPVEQELGHRQGATAQDEGSRSEVTAAPLPDVGVPDEASGESSETRLENGNDDEERGHRVGAEPAQIGGTRRGRGGRVAGGRRTGCGNGIPNMLRRLDLLRSSTASAGGRGLRRRRDRRQRGPPTIDTVTETFPPEELGHFDADEADHFFKNNIVGRKRHSSGWRSFFSKNRNSPQNSLSKNRKASTPGIVTTEKCGGSGGGGAETVMAEMRRKLRTVKSAESLTSGISEVPLNNEIIDSLGPLQCLHKPPGHNRSVSHDSYFDTIQNSHNNSEGSLLDLSEIQLNFDLEESEMRIFSEDESLVSSPRIQKDKKIKKIIVDCSNLETNYKVSCARCLKSNIEHFNKAQEYCKKGAYTSHIETEESEDEIENMGKRITKKPMKILDSETEISGQSSEEEASRINRKKDLPSQTARHKIF